MAYSNFPWVFLCERGSVYANLVNVTLTPPPTPRVANYHIHCSNNTVKGNESVSDYLFAGLIIQTQFQSTKTAETEILYLTLPKSRHFGPFQEPLSL